MSIQVELITENFPKGEALKDTLIGIYGAPLSGKSQTSLILGSHIAKLLDYGLVYIDCDNELPQEILNTWDTLKELMVSYHDFTTGNWFYNFEFTKKTTLKEMNNVIIVDAIPKLHSNLSVVGILNFLYYFLKKKEGNVVIAVNHIMGTDVPWYHNFYLPYLHYDISVKPTLTLKQREKTHMLTTEFMTHETNYNDVPFTGKTSIYYPKGANDE